jgi:GxxExxY protein
MADHEPDLETRVIIGCALRVHRELGPGFLEAVYKEALGIELDAVGVPHKVEVRLPVRFRGHVLNAHYRADIVCHAAVIIEVKAQKGLTIVDEAQVLNYLKAGGLQRALLFNFGTRSLQIRRFVL